MKTKTAAIAATLLIALLIFSWLLLFGDTTSRIRQEHGLTLPASASAIECRGDAWLRIVSDCGAASCFEIPAGDVPAFLAQLHVRSTSKRNSEFIFPANTQYHVRRSWMSGHPMATYHCNSPTGSELLVQTWPVGASRVGVCLYTDWN
jgi:hypothetical protein